MPFVTREVRRNIADGNLLGNLDGADRGENQGECILVPVPFGIGGTAKDGLIRNLIGRMKGKD